MKRLYVTLIIMAAMLFWAVTGFGQKKAQSQKPQLDTFEKRMQLREEIHRRMMDKLLHGMGPDEDLFKDLEQMMNDSFADSFSSFQSFDSVGLQDSVNNFQMEWLETKTGRTLAITPKDPKQQLDINVQNEMITIKGKREIKSEQGSSLSSFTNSFNVPSDCDGSKVAIKQDDGKILIELPYRKGRLSTPSTVKEKAPDRVPLEPSEDDVTI